MYDNGVTNITRGTLGTPVVPPNSSPVTLYTVPKDKTAILAGLIVSNLTDNADVVFTISFVRGGVELPTVRKSILYKIQNNVVLFQGWELSGGESIVVYSYNGNGIAFAVSGEEYQG